MPKPRTRSELRVNEEHEECDEGDSISFLEHTAFRIKFSVHEPPDLRSHPVLEKD